MREVMKMKEKNQSSIPHYRDGRGLDRMPAGTPWSATKPNEGREIDPKHPPYAEAPPINPQYINPNPIDPPVSDPPVPNRAHTEMRSEFPPEMPMQGE